MPLQASWTGTLALPEANVAFHMDLDLSAGKPNGRFVVGKETTPIPEVVRTGNSLALTFSEYGAEMRAAWDGHQLKGEYLRLRSTGIKSFPFSASPEQVATTENPVGDAPVGTFRVAFEDQKEGDGITLAKLWKENDSYYGTFIAPDGDYGLLEGGPASPGIQLHRFTGWQVITIRLDAGRLRLGRKVSLRRQ